jgi:hypothetical protein
MPRPISKKCQECSTHWFKGTHIRPKCYIEGACQRKRNYYRYLDKKREYERKHHHYLRYFDGKCAICDSVNILQVHHIKSQFNGGEHTSSNCMTLCAICHAIITKYYQAIRGIKQVEER